MTSETKPCAPATCKFCGTTASIGTSNCTSYERAIAKTDKHPCGCPWFDEESRAFFAKKHGPAQGQGHDAAAKIVEDRMIWWRNSSDERIRDGSENKFIADAIRALTARVEPVAWGRVINGRAITVSRERTGANNEPLYATPPAETMREQMLIDLRRLAIKQCVRPAQGGGYVNSGKLCEVCKGEWADNAPEFHAATCTALLPPDAGERG